MTKKQLIALFVLLTVSILTYSTRCKLGNGYYTDRPIIGFFGDLIEYRCPYIK